MKLHTPKVAVVLVMIFWGLQCSAEKVFDFNATCEQAYREITCLRLNAGQQLINKARLEKPDNLIPDLLQSYIDFYILFLNENPDDYKEREGHFDEYMDRLGEG